MAEGVREPYGGLFYERALIPFIRAPLLRPNHLPKAPLSHIRIRFQHRVFVQSLSHVTLCAPWTTALQAFCPSLSPGVCSNSCPLSW